MFTFICSIIISERKTLLESGTMSQVMAMVNKKKEVSSKDCKSVVTDSSSKPCS
jgi:uncharacterized protein YqgV (UPF0045/DUF77 family)